MQKHDESNLDIVADSTHANLSDAPFHQEDWEFELDVMRNPTHAQLAEHLSRAPVNDSDTVEFLRGYMIDINIRDLAGG